MFKKVLLILVALIVVGGGAFYMIKGQDTYEAQKYSASVSNGLNVGSEISLTIPDQFNTSHSVNRDTKTLILTFAKDTGHTVKAFLTRKDRDYLSNKNALFVADISPMPVVIRNTFALPDLQKSPFSVLLIYDEKISEKFKDPKHKDEIGIVTLDNGVVKSVEYITTEDELTEALN